MTTLLNFLNEHDYLNDQHILQLDLAAFNRVATLPIEKYRDESNLLLNALVNMLNDDSGVNDLMLPSDFNLINQMVESQRYADVEVIDIISLADDIKLINFKISDHANVIVVGSHAGTLLSWQKDLQFLTGDFKSTILKINTYIEKNIEKNKQFILTGYSVGASLLINSLFNAKKLENVQVVLFDSPGVKTNKNKIQLSVIELSPALSPFVMIGEHMVPQISIKSSAPGFWQHDLYSWQADRNGDFLQAVGFVPQKIDNKRFSKFIPEKTSQENLKLSLLKYSELFEKLPFKEINELMKNWNNFLMTTKKITQEDNIVVKTIIKRINQQLFVNVAENIQHK